MSKTIIMLEAVTRSESEIAQTPEGSATTAARVISFDVDDDTGALSVMDIAEADRAWWALDFILGGLHGDVFVEIPHPHSRGNRFCVDVTKLVNLKTRSRCIAGLLAVMEKHYKTGLDISKPTDTYKRGPGGRFANG